ncbi:MULTISPECIES: CdiA C-terminal domain-containing protein [Paenibacillus]|uniref:CdiA C-terminal domain-containing protein n=1 Tax=Paenibacillus TaxID=44249 RepID=UPI002116FC5B|nr:hypothetical protein [Paenibacillus odorifer]
MASTKLIFNADEVQRLRTKIGQVSQDTNRLYLQLKGQASNWSGIPLGSSQVKAQLLINELTVEAEKLEDIIRGAIKGVQGAEDENKRQAKQLFQQLGVLGGMFERFGGGSAIGKSSTPTTAQKAVMNLITSVATLRGWDELSRDPMVQKLQATVKNSGLGTIDSIAAQSKLKDIYLTPDQIAKAQTAYKVYQTFGNQAQMDAMHKLAEDARKKLESMGVDAVQYQVGKDLSGYFKQAAVKSCDYDPSITTKSVPLMENEKYAFLLRMSMEKGTKGDWAKQQLAMMKPQSTIGSYDPHDFVSDEDILNRNNPEVIKRLQGTYWFDLSIEEQDRRFAETKAYYEKHEKEVADKNRLLGSGVGNQTIANILEGGSSILTHAIDTASFGMAGTITDWIVGPKPKGYVDPMDDPYGKKAGQFAGQLISIGLPFKYLKAVKTPGMLGKFSPTLLKSMVSGAISGTIGEAFDTINDYRDDGKQSLGERIGAIGINTVIAGAGDVAIRAGSKVLASTMRFVSGKLSKIKVPNFEAIKKNVLENIWKSKAARETSNYGEYLKKEKELLKEIEKKKALEGTGKGGANLTEPSLSNGGKPKGNYTKGDSHGVKKEIETADIFADQGYDIEMLDEVNGGNGRGIKESSNPDFLIEGEVFDCYAPTIDTNVDNILRNIRTKTKSQAERIVLNLDGFTSEKITEITEGVLRKANPNGDLKNLQELLIVVDGKITRIFGG